MEQKQNWVVTAGSVGWRPLTVLGAFHATWKGRSRDEETVDEEKGCCRSRVCSVQPGIEVSNGGDRVHACIARWGGALALRRTSFAFFLCIMSGEHC